MSEKFPTWPILPVFFCLAVLLHFPGFHSRMIYDSFGFIQAFNYVFASHDLAAIIGLEPARPLTMVTFYVNFLASGMNTYGFRIFNAFVLACASLALTWLCIVLLELPAARIPGTRLQKRLMGFFCGLWFLVHPLQGLTVLYIWQREASLACLFYFSALAVYLKGRSGQGMPPFFTYLTTSLLFFAGMLSKENVMTLPVVLVLAEFILLAGAQRLGQDTPACAGDPPQVPRLSNGLREIAARVLLIGVITVPPFLLSIALTKMLHAPDAHHPGDVLVRLAVHYQTAGITFSEVVLTQCRMLFWYFYTMVAPWFSGIDLITPCVISRSLWNPPATAAGVAGAISLVTFGLFLMRRHALPAFGIFFVFITLAPESLLIPQYLFCGYRALLPMAGVLFVLAAVVVQFVSATSRMWRVCVAGVLGGLVVCLAAMTFVQANNWSPLPIWIKAHARMPRFSKNVEETPYLDVLGNYATELIRAESYDQAIGVLDQVILITSSPDISKKTLALANKGLALSKQGDPAGALEALREAHRLEPHDFRVLFSLAEALLEQGAKEEGIEKLRKTIELNPRYLPARLRLAHLMRETGRFQEAIESFQEAARANPRSADIQNALGAAQESAGNLSLALESYRKAIRWEPQSASYHFNLAKCLGRLGNVAEAIEHYRKATQLNPSYGPALANLGTMLLKSGRMNEAVVSFERALAIIHNNAELHVQAATALTSLGRKAEARGHLERALAIDPIHKGARQQLDRLTTHEPIPEKAHP